MMEGQKGDKLKRFRVRNLVGHTELNKFNVRANVFSGLKEDRTGMEQTVIPLRSSLVKNDHLNTTLITLICIFVFFLVGFVYSQRNGGEFHVKIWASNQQATNLSESEVAAEKRSPPNPGSGLRSFDSPSVDLG